jgi:hypothetical protein
LPIAIDTGKRAGIRSPHWPERGRMPFQLDDDDIAFVYPEEVDRLGQLISLSDDGVKFNRCVVVLRDAADSAVYTTILTVSGFSDA